MEILLIGAQGSGKGTQADKLAQALCVPHIASGDLFRKEMEEKTTTGQQAASYIKRGELVPDHLTVTMILHRLEQTDCKTGVILDGFPRTIAQAKVLDEGLRYTGRDITAAVYLQVPREKLVQRLSGRYICKAQQHVYNLYSRPPRLPGICDLDGSILYQRPDDMGETIQRRLDIFFHQTIRLLDYYGKQGKVATINGDQEIEQVHHEIISTFQHIR
jgi:adenylate kinase